MGCLAKRPSTSGDQLYETSQGMLALMMLVRLFVHMCEVVTPAQAGVQSDPSWMPAPRLLHTGACFAGMTCLADEFGCPPSRA